MSKKEEHKSALDPLLEGYLKTGDEYKVFEYLVSNSGLPGRRANLELAYGFSEIAGEHAVEKPEEIWNLCLGLVGLSSVEAPLNDPREFLPFCGAIALGAVGSALPEYYERSLARLRRIADDPRWRLREAVAMGVQRLIGFDSINTLRALEGWIEDEEWLAMRAVVGGVAEPHLLRDEDKARRSLGLHRKVFERVLASDERRSDEFRTLRKGLAYTLSVVVRAIPDEGFEYIRQLIGFKDRDILWIIRANLKKNRLVKNFPDEVAETKQLLN